MLIKIAILVSGRGSNMEAILRAIKNNQLQAKVEVVISNNPEALALSTARKYGVHAVAIDSKGLSREEHERRVLSELAMHEIDYVVLAGYMRLLSAKFLQEFRHRHGYYRVINIHPSLLPAFPGASAYEDAFAAGVKQSGITIHLVDEKMDHGPILSQKSFPRLDGDTIDTFKARGLQIEHELFPACLQEIASGGIVLPNHSEARA
jgi:phosphoribosylglycinamide formyltransferase-1